MSARRELRLLVAALCALLVACTAGRADLPINPSTPGTPAAGPFEGGLLPWRATLPKGPAPLTASPGGTWSVDVELDVDLGKYVPEMGRFRRLVAVVYGEQTYDAQGQYRSNGSDIVLSSSFTGAGVPIVNPDIWPDLRLRGATNAGPFEGHLAFDLPDPDDVARVHHLQGRIDVAVPADIAAGWWHPRMTLLVEVEGVQAPLFLKMFFRERQEPAPRGFPLVAIGAPAPPHVPWTAFPVPRLWGRAGTLPQEVAGKVALAVHAIFPTELILPPGRYPVGPGLPTLEPLAALPEVYSSEDQLPNVKDPDLIAEIAVDACVLTDPEGRQSPCVADPVFVPTPAPDPTLWTTPPLGVDLSQTGTYRLTMKGHVRDPFGRRSEAGGTYVVHSALPLSFSTSCKPGTSFLVGNGYPAKVNVNPPVRATVEVRVAYYPNSDPARERVWVAKGQANRFGHFAADGPPIVFDEAGEYVSLVKATYRDHRGRLWMGLQSSTGVVAPVVPDPDVHLRPAGRVADGVALTWDGKAMRYAERLHAGGAVLFKRESLLRSVRSPGLPQDPSDTLFVAVQPDGLEVQTRFTADVRDPDLARRLLAASTAPSAVAPRDYQRIGRPWTHLQGVVLGATVRHGLVWTEATPGRTTDLPVGPVHADDAPGGRVVDGWVSQGVVRPGVPAVVSVSQLNGWGESWRLSPNSLGFQINAGKNGDMPGDIYRVQAGLVLKDLVTGVNHYDLYASTVVIADGSLPVSSILPPGTRPVDGGPQGAQYLMLASDTHDAMEVGEDLHFGGMVFPNVSADVTWQVTLPSGDERVASGLADRRGIVRGMPGVPIDQPGIYAIRARARYKGLEGGIPGTRDGRYFVCALPTDDPSLLTTTLPAVTTATPTGTLLLPLQWPRQLTNVRIHFGVITPGRVLEQGEVRPTGTAWAYGFTPTQAVVQRPSFDVSVLAIGQPKLSETVVFQFCLEATDGARPVVDSLRLVLRGDKLLNLSGL